MCPKSGGEVGAEALRMPEPGVERGCLAIAADVGEVILQQPTPLWRGVEQPVRPAPGLGVVVLRQFARRGGPQGRRMDWPA